MSSASLYFTSSAVCCFAALTAKGPTAGMKCRDIISPNDSKPCSTTVSTPWYLRLHSRLQSNNQKQRLLLSLRIHELPGVCLQVHALLGCQCHTLPTLCCGADNAGKWKRINSPVVVQACRVLQTSLTTKNGASRPYTGQIAAVNLQTHHLIHRITRKTCRQGRARASTDQTFSSHGHDDHLIVKW